MAAPRTAEQRADLVRIEGVIKSVRQVGDKDGATRGSVPRVGATRGGVPRVGAPCARVWCVRTRARMQPRTCCNPGACGCRSTAEMTASAAWCYRPTL
jgi:hypothetical protein